MIKSEDLQKKIHSFYDIYKKYIGLKRFSIPVIGKISTGKSTFLNYLIHLNKTLEIKADIATKFICIIRHNKNNKTPKIYETKAILRGNNEMTNTKIQQLKGRMMFNFEKGKELKGENINSIISQRNETIVNKQDLILDPLYYFLIIEVNIPLFNGELEEYGDLFEFMDVPGLNEISDKGNDVSDNFYFKEIIPIIIPNIKFSFLLFDSVKFNDEDTKDILIKLGDGIDNNSENKLGHDVLLNSIFILNKIDTIGDSSEEGRKDFINHAIKGISQKDKLTYLNGKLNENNFIGISSRLLLKKSFKYDSFKNYLDCIIEESIQKKIEKKEKENKEEKKEEKKEEVDNNFSDYLFTKFKQEIHKKIKQYEYESDSDEEEEEEEEEKKEEEDKELEDISKLIKTHFEGDFTMKEYKYYEEKFNKFKKSIKKSEDKDLKKIDEICKNKIKDVINNYTKLFEQFKSIEDEVKSSIKILVNEKITLFSQLKKNPDLIGDPKETNKKIGEIISK